MGDGELAPLGNTPASRRLSLASAPTEGQASRERMGRYCRLHAKTVLPIAPEWWELALLLESMWECCPSPWDLTGMEH